LASFDNWERALEIYNVNFAHKAAKPDLSDVGGAVAELQKHPASMIIGGPPAKIFPMRASAQKKNALS
jgi:hypothetical protein